MSRVLGVLSSIVLPDQVAGQTRRGGSRPVPSARYAIGLWARPQVRPAREGAVLEARDARPVEVLSRLTVEPVYKGEQGVRAPVRRPGEAVEVCLRLGLRRLGQVTEDDRRGGAGILEGDFGEEGGGVEVAFFEVFLLA